MVKALNNLLDRKEKAVYNDLNVRMLKGLGELEKGLTGFAMRHPRLFRMFITPQLRQQPELFALFSNTITLTSIDSENDVVNVIPSKMNELLDYKLLPKTESDEIIEDIKKRLKNPNIKVSTIYQTPPMKSSDIDNKYLLHPQA